MWASGRPDEAASFEGINKGNTYAGSSFTSAANAIGGTRNSVRRSQPRSMKPTPLDGTNVIGGADGNEASHSGEQWSGQNRGRGCCERCEVRATGVRSESRRDVRRSRHLIQRALGQDRELANQCKGVAE